MSTSSGRRDGADVERLQNVSLEMLLTWTDERWVIDGVGNKYTTPA